MHFAIFHAFPHASWLTACFHAPLARLHTTTSPSLESTWRASRPKPSPRLPSLIEESFLSSNPLGMSYISHPEEHCRAHIRSSPHPLIIPCLQHDKQWQLWEFVQSVSSIVNIKGKVAVSAYICPALMCLSHQSKTSHSSGVKLMPFITC